MTVTETSSQNRNSVKVSISKDMMGANIVIPTPPAGSQPPSAQQILKTVAEAGVVYGIDKSAIETAISELTLNTPVRIASGTKPERGQDAKFEYHFDTEQKHAPQEDSKGHIDYRNISYIQNTVKDSILVTKTPPTIGEPGKTVTGKELSGLSGRDASFSNGENTQVSEDGLSLTASASGAIVFQRGKVSVRDILKIPGDVDVSVGNIDCLGTVIIQGNVCAGFEIKVDGDLEVGGNIEDAIISAGGNILVKGGFFGGGTGILKANGNITLKFAEGQKIIAGGTLSVGGDLINCDVFANESVEIKGSQGKITGGETRARKEIITTNAGSDIGTKTILRVAFDPSLHKRHLEITEELERLEQDRIRVKGALYNLYRLQMDNKLPKEKMQALAQFESFQKDLPESIENLTSELEKVLAKMKECQDARITIKETLFSGVVTYFGQVNREFLNDTSGAIISYDGTAVRVSALED